MLNKCEPLRIINLLLNFSFSMEAAILWLFEDLNSFLKTLIFDDEF